MQGAGCSLSSSATVAFLMRLPSACFATSCRAFSTSGSSGILLFWQSGSRRGHDRVATVQRRAAAARASGGAAGRPGGPAAGSNRDHPGWLKAVQTHLEVSFQVLGARGCGLAVQSLKMAVGPSFRSAGVSPQCTIVTSNSTESSEEHDRQVEPFLCLGQPAVPRKTQTFAATTAPSPL